MCFLTVSQLQTHNKTNGIRSRYADCLGDAFGRLVIFMHSKMCHFCAIGLRKARMARCEGMVSRT